LELNYLVKGIEQTLLKRERKSTILESVRSGRSQPPHGMTKEEAVILFSQDIADYDAILLRFGSSIARER
jgi:hypothetical protein